ncbi:MAG: hypothetical protein JG762_973 [Deferribacteraceae bacterium]|jgi:hypothetical protein|nr:hypothetical protein [Deferribacteraceae bacterium]
MGKGKTLCAIFKKDMSKKELEDYAKIVIEGNYICKKCGRVANKEDYLCKSYKIKS